MSERANKVILIGRERTAVDDAADRLLDGCIIALQEFDTETLEAIAELRDEINPGGWMQAMIRGYVEVWR
jgi:short-subunit dehydrogenase